MDDVVVRIDFLEAVARQLLDHVRREHGETVTLDEDYFWHVPFETRYDPSSQPAELTIGQLTEDVDNLRRLAEDPEHVISYGLVWLGELLQYIAASRVG